jgi:2',5'-phosphodiesterase
MDMGNQTSIATSMANKLLQSTNNVNHITTTKLRIVSYNVLSSQLANIESYPTYNPQYLNSSYRLQKVIQKLEKEITNTCADSTSTGTGTAISNPSSQHEQEQNRATIFCLQEVSYEWAGPLHAFFANHKYHVVSGLYGQKFNGYMGIITAYPIEQFHTVHVDICRLSDTYHKWPKKPKEEPVTPIKHVTKLLRSTLQWFNVIPNDEREPECHWMSAQRRYNVLLSIVLCEINNINNNNNDNTTYNTEFVVSNYHMPCVYYNEKVMVIHSDLCVSRVQTIANQQYDSIGIPSPSSSSLTTTTTIATNNNELQPQQQLRPKRRPYIIAGDFNIKPLDVAYTLLTTGTIDRNHIAYPTIPIYDPIYEDWKPLLLEPVRSVYALHNKTNNNNDNSNDRNKIPNGTHGHATGTGEPDFTNFGKMGDKDAFIDTLDYIFISNDNNNNLDHDNNNNGDIASDQYRIVVSDVLELPNRNYENVVNTGPYPNGIEPSDHIMIAANIDVSFFPKGNNNIES